MRGTLAVVSYHNRYVGIIPAHAGNTDPADLRDGYNGDHPRACGEHVIGGNLDSEALGSSPRMRGTLPRTFF